MSGVVQIMQQHVARCESALDVALFRHGRAKSDYVHISDGDSVRALDNLRAAAEAEFEAIGELQQAIKTLRAEISMREGSR